MKRLFLLLIYIICVAPRMGAVPSFWFQTLDISKGLSSNMTTCMLRDCAGYVWIGTAHGLNRFDGCRVRRYFLTGQMDDDCIRSLAQDADGVLWVGVGESGYVLYRPDRDTFDSDVAGRLRALGMKDVPKTFTLKTDRQGDLWLWSPQRVWHYRFAGKTWRSFPLQGVDDLCVAPDTALAIAHDRTLTRLISTSGRLQADASLRGRRPLPKGLRNHVHADSRGRVWVYDDARRTLLLRETPGADWQDMEPLLNGNEVYSLASDQLGNLYIATGEGGLYGYTGASTGLRRLNAESARVPAGTVTTVYLTEGDALWLGYERRGVAYCAGCTSMFLVCMIGDYKNPDSHDELTALCTTPVAASWYGLRGKGVNRIGIYGQVNCHLDLPQGDNTVVSMAEGKDGSIWALTSTDGIYLLDGHGIRSHLSAGERGLESRQLVETLADTDGSIWVAGNRGMQRWDDRRQQFDAPCVREAVKDVCLGREGHLYVLTEQAVCDLDVRSGKATEVPLGEGTPKVNVLRNLFCDSRGWLWAGSLHGVCIHASDGSNLLLDKRDGLDSELIQGVIEDFAHDVWVTTEHGILRVKVGGDGRTPQASDLRTDLYTERDGMVSALFNPRALYIYDTVGNIAAGTPDGTIFIVPQLIADEKQHGSIRFTELHIDGVCRTAAIDSEQWQEVPPGASFTVCYSAMQEDNTLRYAWRLVKTGLWSSIYDIETGEGGTAGGWHCTNLSDVTFSRLPSGSYRFEVRVCSDGADEASVLLLHVQPSPWATWWAYTLYIMLALAIGMVVWKALKKRQQYRQHIQTLQVELAATLAVRSAKQTAAQAGEGSDLLAGSNTAETDGFVDKAIGVVERHLDDANYTVEQFSSDMYMSRANLYKRLMAVTGHSPLEFIRIVRLRKAKQLLTDGKMTVAEVAYSVGFNSPKVFSKYFKEEFGVTPSSCR